MRKNFIFTLTLTALIILSSCKLVDTPQNSNTQPNDSIPDNVTSATILRYRPNELKVYEGTRLDPAIGPRDNSIKGIQNVDISGYSLKIDGLVNVTKEFTYDNIVAMPPVSRVYTVFCVEGWDSTILWKGVLVKDLLQSAEVQSEAKTVIFHAVDGYTTSLQLSEILDKNLMIAYNANGLPLPAALGFPFIFVAQDKWGYKWARWINRIELSSNTQYKGYWEDRGYGIDGSIKK